MQFTDLSRVVEAELDFEGVRVCIKTLTVNFTSHDSC